MSKKPEEEIEERLHQLELSMKEASASNVPASIEKSAALSKSSAPVTTVHGNAVETSGGGSLKADFCLLGGFAGLLIGLFLLFSNLWVVRTGGFGPLGPIPNGGGGLVFLLLLGMGFFFYDHKNKIGWVLIFGSLASLVYMIFLTMGLELRQMNLLNLITIFLPLVVGAGLLAKGIKLHSAIEDRSKEK